MSCPVVSLEYTEADRERLARAAQEREEAIEKENEEAHE